MITSQFFEYSLKMLLIENIRILHKNMLFPIQTVTDQDLITTTTESVNKNRRQIALMKANALMNIHF